MSQLLVDSGYPALPFFIGDHGIDSNRSITLLSGSTVLPSGQVLAKSGSVGKYIPYNGAGAGDETTAVGILFNRTDRTGGDALAAMFVHGVVRSGSLTGIDAAGIADLQDQIQFV